MSVSSCPAHPVLKWLCEPDRLALFGLLGLLFAFYPELFLVKAAPLTGDHLEQHYPWAFALAQSLKEFKLPFWTPLIHCGFPLVAESQVGAFYIPNLLMYFFLPFRMAYSYMNLIHWFIAGWGTYAYAKQMKLGAMPSFVAAVIFVFGSAYGGAYYNMTSLKTICWFPLALFLLERYLIKPNVWLLLGIGLVIGQSLVAGYLQMAVFTWLIFYAYATLRIVAFPENVTPWKNKTRLLGAVIIPAVFAILIALPQIYLTFQLAMLSNRSGLEEGYAYLGSMSPLALATLINPNLSLIFRGNNLYAGSFALFLVLLSFSSRELRKSKTLKIWSVITLLAFLLSMGQWSPLYVAIVKLTKFYSFRVPAKFLGFICFGLAMLGGFGFQVLWQGRSTQTMVKKAFWAYLTILLACGGFMVSAYLFLTAGRNFAIKAGDYFVRQFIYGKAGHPHSLEHYLSVVRGYPDNALNYLSLSAPANGISIVLIISCIVLLWFFIRKKKVRRAWLIAGILLLLVDLYMATYPDIRGDLATYRSAQASSSVVKALQQERSSGRLTRIYGFRGGARRLPLVPSQNMCLGIADIGVYSPLVSQRYFQTIGLFGNINDSNYAVKPTVGFVAQRLPVLSFLNVSHVLSTEPLIHPDLQLIFADSRTAAFLYANQSKHAAAYFISDVKSVFDWEMLKTDFLNIGFDPAKTLLMEVSELRRIGSEGNSFSSPDNAGSAVILNMTDSRDDLLIWSVMTRTKGFFVLSNMMMPGWRAKLDGVEVPILKAYGMFQAIYIPEAGNHQIELEFKPFAREGRE